MPASVVEAYLREHKEVDLKVFLEESIDSFDVNPGLIREIANILRREDKYEINKGALEAS